MPHTIDLVGYALNKDPVEFENAFDSLVRSKIADKIESARIDVATSIYGQGPEEDEFGDEDFEFSYDEDLGGIELDVEDIDTEE